jgi:hypothetical protein
MLDHDAALELFALVIEDGPVLKPPAARHADVLGLGSDRERRGYLGPVIFAGHGVVFETGCRA